MTTEAVAILDFGSQYAQLIARRVREARVYCELVPWNAPYEQIERLKPRGFILSGGPASVYDQGAPTLPDYVLASGLPVLGICYGMQMLAHALGGRVAPAGEREYGPAELSVLALSSPLFAGLPFSMKVWMSHVNISPTVIGTNEYEEHSPLMSHIKKEGIELWRARTKPPCSEGKAPFGG